MASPPRRPSIVLIATGRYQTFVPAVVASAWRHLVGLDQVFVISDARPAGDSSVTWLPWGHSPWPYPTLLRYRAITAYEEILGAADTLLYCDVDMRMQRDIEIPAIDGTLAVRHPGYVGVRADELPYERRIESTSCIPAGEGSTYFAGGVQGGAALAYLNACKTMAGWIQADLARGIVPVWHDESAWNRFCATNAPELILPESYCSPDNEQNAGAFIVALDKNHDRLRGTALTVRAGKRYRAVRSWLIRVAKSGLGYSRRPR